MNQSTRIVLLDNGSLRPEAVFCLRHIASDLSERIGSKVHPVSLLHSSKITPEKLDGIPANVWRRFLRIEIEKGAKRFVVLPLFFGPSSAIIDYLPDATQTTLWKLKRFDIDLLIADPLVESDGDETFVAEMLADLILKKMDTESFESSPCVVLVDHGSPVKAVAESRDLVARQLKEILGDRIASVVPSSMERRAGQEYDFNEPLLETALEQLSVREEKQALICLMFFSPGRHAGPGGDIEAIVAGSSWVKSGRKLPVCDLVGSSPLLVDILCKRYQNLTEDLD